jgi:hypothetical protein
MDNKISYVAHYDLLTKMKEYGFTYKKMWRFQILHNQIKSFFQKHTFSGGTEADRGFNLIYKRHNEDMVRDILEKMLEVPPSSTLEVLLIMVHNLRIDDGQFRKRSRMRLFELTKEDLQPDYLFKLFKEYEEEAITSSSYFFVRQKNTVFQRKSKNRKKYSRSRKLGRKKSRRKRKSRSRRYTPLS